MMMKHCTQSHTYPNPKRRNSTSIGCGVDFCWDKFLVIYKEVVQRSHCYIIQKACYRPAPWEHAWACVALWEFLTQCPKVLKATYYCKYVVFSHIDLWHQLSSPSEDYKMLLPWPLMGVALLLAVIVISVVCSYLYVKRGKAKSMPQSLVRMNFSSVHLSILVINRLMEMLPVWRPSGT